MTESDLIKLLELLREASRCLKGGLGDDATIIRLRLARKIDDLLGELDV